LTSNGFRDALWRHTRTTSSLKRLITHLSQSHSYHERG
jgi:hypothetical protein